MPHAPCPILLFLGCANDTAQYKCPMPNAQCPIPNTYLLLTFVRFSCWLL
ncbi:hypothetical protein [Nostoc sp.]